MRSTTSAFAAATLSAALTAAGLFAFDATNADKVDGKHAVSAGASTNERKGKLVATSGTSGKLPNDIIARAPDASRLAGTLPQSYRTLQLVPKAANLGEGATAGGVALRLPSAGNGSGGFSFIVPPSYPGWPTPIHADIVYYTSSAVSCSIVLQQFGGYGPGTDGEITTGQWNTPGDAPIDVAGGSGPYHHARITFVPVAGRPPAAGMVMTFSLRRTADEPGDDCPNMDVYGIQISY